MASLSLFENVATAALTVFALALSLIALRAWRHTGAVKVLLIGIGFLLFFAKGVVLSVGLFAFPEWDELIVPSLVFDLCILSVFYVAVLK